MPSGARSTPSAHQARPGVPLVVMRLRDALEVAKVAGARPLRLRWCRCSRRKPPPLPSERVPGFRVCGTGEDLSKKSRRCKSGPVKAVAGGPVSAPV
jgi:hypothetical protein